MKKFFIIISFILSGCAHMVSAPYKAVDIKDYCTVNISTTTEELVSDIGPPTSSFNVNENTKVFSYVEDEGTRGKRVCDTKSKSSYGYFVYSDTYTKSRTNCLDASVKQKCNTIYKLKNDIVVECKQEGNTCKSLYNETRYTIVDIWNILGKPYKLDRSNDDYDIMIYYKKSSIIPDSWDNKINERGETVKYYESDYTYNTCVNQYKLNKRGEVIEYYETNKDACYGPEGLIRFFDR